MFKPIFRLTLVTFVWHRYKRNIVATIIALGLIAVVALIHSDYLDYLEQTQQTASIGWSFVFKWSLYALILLAWLTCLKLNAKPRSVNALSSRPNPAKPKQSASRQDPFANLRNKERLKGRGDRVIQKK